MTDGSASAADLADLGRVHVVGIGGAGMSGIARIMLARGVPVSGSDAKDSRRVAAVRALGARVEIGHDAANLGDADTVVVSTAIPATNVELVEATRRGLRVLSRAQALAAVMSGFRVVAVSGTHGKTTTTSMLTVALQHCGADPSFVIGSELNESGSNAHLGTGDLFVVEADESDGSFLLLSAAAGIVTNVEPDHLDHWGTFDAIEDAFADFVADISARGGFTVVCIDDEGGRRLAARARAEGSAVRTYGESPDAEFRIEGLASGDPGWSFEVVHRGVRLGEFALQVPGRHNALNATAAFAAAVGLGLPASDVRDGLQTFSGTRRRFDFKGQAVGVRVYDDYAHHPTEIAATLRAAREVVGDGRLVVAFQAHHYYRTALFVREFGEALGLADEVVVLEVYAPGEEPIPGASGQTMAAHVPLPVEQVVFEPSWSAVAGHLAGRARSGDIVMTLGAGDIGMLAGEVLDLLRKREAGDGAA
jgi:UDP-N-acetylmuramate--alanine ligase